MAYSNSVQNMNRGRLVCSRGVSLAIACVIAVAGPACSKKARKAPTGSTPVTAMDSGTPIVRDASMPDASESTGLSLEDLYGDELCTFAEEDVMAFEAHTQAVRVGLAERANDVALAYHNGDGHRTVRLMGLSGPAQSGAAVEDAQASSGVRIVDVDGGFALTWWQGSELLAQRVGSDGDALGAPESLGDFSGADTTNMLSDSETARVYVGVQMGGQLDVGSYPEGNAGAAKFDQVFENEPGLEHAVLAMVEGVPSVAWSSDGDVSLSGLETHRPMSLAEGGSGFFDLAGGPESGALAYSWLLSDAELVGYQPFEEEGNLRLSPRTVQRAPAQLRDVSIVPFGRGFALAYRSLVSRDFPSDTIRVAFMNQTGELVYEGEIGTTSRAGGPTDIVATADGHVVVAWNDTDDNQVHLRRLNCPVALKLCNVR